MDLSLKREAFFSRSEKPTLLFRFSIKAAHGRSEDMMRFNHFDSTILGTINHGQVIVVDGKHRGALRELVFNFARHSASFLGALRLGALPLASWRALKRTPAGMTPAMAMCPSYTARRRQRQQRWTPGVVVGPGPVGVC